MASRKNVPASQVRSWARENMALIPEAAQAGLGETARGRLHPEIVAAFKKANPRFTYETASEAEKPTVTVAVKTKNARGANITKNVTVTTEAARALLGHPKGRKGRFNKGALAEALASQGV